MFIRKRNDVIKITEAKIVLGDYRWMPDAGVYMPVASSDIQEQYLQIDFDVCKCTDIDFFMVSGPGLGDVQHTRRPDQRSFFFPLQRTPLEQLKVFAYQLENKPGYPVPIKRQVGSSRLIIEVMNKAKVTSLLNCQCPKSKLVA